MGKRKKSRVSHEEEEEEEEEELNQENLNQTSPNDKDLYETLASRVSSPFKRGTSRVLLNMETTHKVVDEFKSFSPYGAVLGVERTASQQEIKKAYYKLALRLHPDKNPGDEEAKEKFQQLQKVISILGDEEKRVLYDQTGCVDDADLAGDVVQNLKEFFAAMYKKVTEADIEEFEAHYRGSDSEKRDLIDLYKKCKGNMNRLFCSMLCSDPKLDSHRFKDILDETIAAGELKATKAYQKWAKRVSETKPPTSPLKRKGKSNKQPESDLYAIISQRRSDRKDQFDSMFSSLVSKYGGAAAGSEPTDEEFEAAQKKLDNRRASKKSNRKSNRK